MMSSVPAQIRPASNDTMPGTEKPDWAPCTTGSVTARSISPSAVSPSPIHCRRPIRIPKIRSAITSSRTIPPASTDWTRDIGATESAATWKIQATTPIAIPIVNNREPKSRRAVRKGLRMSTAGAEHAPRCLNRKAMFAVRAQASARGIPSRDVMDQNQGDGAGVAG